jgi:hypothetical protein
MGGLPVEPAVTAPAPDATTCAPAEEAKPDGARLYAEVTRQLGHTHRVVDRLGDVWPGPHYEFTTRALDEVGRRLQVWESEENAPLDVKQAHPQGSDETISPR